MTYGEIRDQLAKSAPMALNGKSIGEFRLVVLPDSVDPIILIQQSACLIRDGKCVDLVVLDFRHIIRDYQNVGERYIESALVNLAHTLHHFITEAQRKGEMEILSMLTGEASRVTKFDEIAFEYDPKYSADLRSAEADEK